ncbi:hypothetical protein ADUPG1_007990 [Aduncisulcus paluster]|uniref:Uncharacterized protein n=1 Tax=Aduncisulcus paluster TaxID=2918883 RepID=A0ABQ5KRQ8_9EUKA|nr:hypothetical protein ADUPG1_007990 [Aduncisulcus paluster]
MYIENDVKSFSPRPILTPPHSKKVNVMEKIRLADERRAEQLYLTRQQASQSSLRGAISRARVAIRHYNKVVNVIENVDIAFERHRLHLEHVSLTARRLGEERVMMAADRRKQAIINKQACYGDRSIGAAKRRKQYLMSVQTRALRLHARHIPQQKGCSQDTTALQQAAIRREKFLKSRVEAAQREFIKVEQAKVRFQSKLLSKASILEEKQEKAAKRRQILQAERVKKLFHKHSSVVTSDSK